MRIEKLKMLWIWIERVKLLRLIFFLPIGYVCYLSLFFVQFYLHSSNDYFYLMIFVTEFLGVLIGAYMATIIAPKGKLKIAWIFLGSSVIMLCFDSIISFISLQTTVLHDFISNVLNFVACGIVVLFMLHKIDLMEVLFESETDYWEKT